MRRAVRTALAFLPLLLLAAPARSQISAGGGGQYEARYGAPVDVSLEDLVQSPEGYLDRAVRTHGRLEIDAGGTARRSYLLSSLMSRLTVIPVPEMAGQFEDEAMRMLGQDIQVTGVFYQAQPSTLAGSEPRYGIQFWGFVGPPEKEQKGEIKAPALTLESLVRNPGKHDGQLVRVVGKFRGRNLYGDLPASTQKATGDWVIKDELFAVWVTGRKPKGSGWELDASLKRDTGKWIEVIGRPETRGGVTYVQAVRVNLSAPPTAEAKVAPPPPLPEKPKQPPMVVFALPLDGDVEVGADSRFVVQFSKDMDESTFVGRVQLQYAGARQPGDRDFDGMRLAYDRGRRALSVDPGDQLRPRRVIELRLLPGIADIDGMALVPRTGKMFSDAVDVLRFRTGT